MKRAFRSSLFVAALALASYPLLRAQSVPPEVAKFGYADSVIVNGKIVSMDDQGYNTNPGHIYEAMAIKGDRIMALGANDTIKAMAGPDTKTIDVGGRVITPGIIDPHAHMFGSPSIARSMGINYPDKGTAITVQAGKDMEETRMKVENGIKDAVAKLKPGDWVYVGITPNLKEGVTGPRIFAWTTRAELENVDRLTRIAPQNPVEVKAGTRAIANKSALDLARNLFPDFDDYEAGELPDVKDPTKIGLLGEGAHEALEWYGWFGKQPISLLAEMVRRDWEMAAAHGETSFGSRTYNPRILDSATFINRNMTAPLRYMLLMETHRMPGSTDFAKEMYTMTGNLSNLGSNMMWIGGVSSELWDSSFPLDCLGADLPAPQNIKVREMCRNPGDLFWETLKNALTSGWRLAGVHGVGSDGVRRYMRMIESAMKETGMTDEDARKLHFTIEHAEALGNVPDVIAKIKELGIIVSPNPSRMTKVVDYVRDYGPEAEKFIEPVKSWLDEGVTVVGQFEGYRGIGNQFLYLITREASGRVVLPDQKLDRVTVLKMWTTWAPKYLMKEKDLGSLEAGKLADFVVYDKDFFTIPVPEIPTIKPLMTVLGGKPTHLEADLAKELKMEPVGYQFPPNYVPWGRNGPAAD